VPLALAASCACPVAEPYLPWHSVFGFLQVVENVQGSNRHLGCAPLLPAVLTACGKGPAAAVSSEQHLGTRHPTREVSWQLKPHGIRRAGLGDGTRWTPLDITPLGTCYSLASQTGAHRCQHDHELGYAPPVFCFQFCFQIHNSTQPPRPLMLVGCKAPPTWLKMPVLFLFGPFVGAPFVIVLFLTITIFLFCSRIGALPS